MWFVGKWESRTARRACLLQLLFPILYCDLFALRLKEFDTSGHHGCPLVLILVHKLKVFHRKSTPGAHFKVSPREGGAHRERRAFEGSTLGKLSQ